MAMAAIATSVRAGPHVRGRIVDERTGKPLAGTVRLFRTEDDSAETARLLSRTLVVKPDVEARTGAEGRFDAELPASSGMFRIDAIARGHAYRGVARDIDAAGRDVVLADARLPEGVVVKGRVTSAEGKPIGGATISWVATGPSGPVSAQVASSADGAFVLEGFPQEPATITVRASGFGRKEVHGVRPTPSLELRLAAGLQLAGKIVDAESGAGVAGVLVTSDAGSVTRSDATGKFVLDDLTAGDVRLGTRDDGHAPAQWKGTLPMPKDAAPVIVKVRPGATLVLDVRSRERHEPIADAHLTVRLEGIKERKASTDARGQARVAGLPAGSVRGSITARGYASADTGELALSPGETRRTPVGLERAASLAGIVVDESGKPQPGVNVSIVPKERNGRFGRGGRVRPESQTDADGRFVLEGLSREMLVLRLDRTDLAPREISLKRFQPGESRGGLRLVMDAGGSLAGRVTDTGGAPLGGALVTVSPAREASMGVFGAASDLRSVTTDADGAFVVPALAAGKVEVSAKADGFVASAPLPTTVAKGQRAQVPEIRCKHGALLAGRVVDPRGEPVAGASVHVSGSRAPADRDETDGNGNFRIADLDPSGDVTLEVWGEGLASTQKSGLRPGGDAVQIVLSPQAIVRGRVVEKGTKGPVRSFGVQWMKMVAGGSGGGGMAMMHGGPMQSFQTEDGAFDLDAEAGKLDVTVFAPGYLTATVTGVEAKDGPEDVAPIVVELARGLRLRGRVVDDEHRPLPGARVAAQPASQSNPSMMRMNDGDTVAALTDDDGAFRLDGVPPGVVSLAASVEGRVAARKELTLDGDREGVEITLSKGQTVTGLVRRRDGAPAPETDVLLMQGDSPMAMYGARQETTDGNGAFAFEGVEPGSYQVRATTTSGASSPNVAVVVAGSDPPAPIALQIAAGVRIAGRVTGLEASELPSVSVQAWSDAGGKDARVLPDGTFGIDDVSPGPLELGASTETGPFTGGRTVSRRISVPGDRPSIEVELAFPHGSTLSGRITKAGKPVANATVVAMPGAPAETATRSSSRTREDGTYACEGLSDGEYAVSLLAIETGLDFQTAATVKGDTTHDVEIPTGRVEGRVLDGKSLEPIGSTQVTRKGLDDNPMGAKQAVTDSAGAFVFADVPDGEYMLTPTRSGWAGTSKKVTVQGGEVEGGVDLLMEPEASLILRITDTRTGAAPASVTATVIEGERALSTAELHGDGNAFRVPGLRAGQAALVIATPDAAPVVLPRVPVPGESSVSLSGGGKIEALLARGALDARLVRADGAVQWTTAWGDPSAVIHIVAPQTTIGPVPAGSYRLAAGQGSYPVQVKEGETTTVTIGSE
ncbi:MAG: carboxypeptidase regulatory-like domain-containing protein [Acidobacteriota bacterium]